MLTYAEFFDQHYLPHVKLHKRSWDRDEELYRLRIKAVFGGKRLNQITRHQVQSFHSALAAEGLAAATANHHLKLIRSVAQPGPAVGDAGGREPGGADRDAARGQQDRALPRRGPAAAVAGRAAHGPEPGRCAASRCSCSARAAG